MRIDATGLQTDLSPPAPSAAADGPRLRNAATQFEAMLIGQMLKSVREASGGLTDESEESMNTYTEIAEQQFGRALATQGGLGIAKMVTSQIGNRDANQ